MAEEPSTSEDDSVLADLAAAVVARKMSVPAILFLESYKPLTRVIHAMGVVSIPLLVPLFGSKRCNAVLPLLESKENVERLIGMIEQRVQS